MREVIATVIRIEDTVQVTIHSFLRNNGWVASVTGTSPGDVVHIKDPGHAEVYLEEHETPSSLISLRSPIPWRAPVNIVDLKHNELTIFVNQHEINRVPVTTMPIHFEVYADSRFRSLGHRYHAAWAYDGEPFSSCFWPHIS